MGRGSSKAGTITASGGTSLPPATNFVAPPTPQQIANGNVLPTGGVAFDDFMQMTDDEKAQVIQDALSTGTPLFLDDSGLQRFAYFTGMSDKPTVVTDRQLDSMGGEEIFRTVHDAYDRQKDIGYTANDICDQIAYGDFTMYSDSGGSAHGKAIYFAADYYDSAQYGTGTNSDRMMRARITGGRSIGENAITQQYQRALNNGNSVAQACRRAGYDSAVQIYALSQGYSVINADYGSYRMILNRGALTVSDTYKTNPRRHRSW